MFFLALTFFLIILIRDVKRTTEAYVETNIINYKDLLAILIMIIAIGIFMYFNF